MLEAYLRAGAYNAATVYVSERLEVGGITEFECGTFLGGMADVAEPDELLDWLDRFRTAGVMLDKFHFHIEPPARITHLDPT